MRNGFRRVFSLMAAGVMAVSLFTIGGTGNVSKAETLDSASNVNFDSILGRAVNYGIVADSFELNNHSETNFAVNTFVNLRDQLLEPDLAGDDPMYFILGKTQAGEGSDYDYVRFGQTTYQNHNVDFHFNTTKEVIDSLSKDNNQRKIRCDNNTRPTIYTQEYTSEEIATSIDTMVTHVEQESAKLAAKSGTIDLTAYENEKNITTDNRNEYILDLSDSKYDGKVVYINVLEPTEEMLELGKEEYPKGYVLGSIFKMKGQYTKSVKIKKNSSTVVVFNFNGWKEADIKGPLVQVVGVDSEYTSTETSNGSWDKNEKVDSEIAQKIIWNLPDATKVEIREAAGAVLVPKKDAKVSVESTSAGWVVTGGSFRNNNSEWHYIYMGRQKAANGEITFAAQKKFTRSYDDYTIDPVKKEKNLKDDTTVSTSAGDFKFKLYSSDANFTVNESNLMETVPTTATNSFEFSKLTFKPTDAGKDFYYVIREDATKTKDKITNSDGEIDIKIHVEVNGDVVELKASSWKYLTAKDKNDDDRATATSVENSTAYRVNYNLKLQGTSFTLGSVYNLINEGTLKVTKSVTGAPASASDKEYSFTVKNKAGKYIKADGTVSDTEVIHNVKDGETKTFDGLAINDTYTVTEVESSLVIDNYTLDSTSKKTDSVEISKAGDTKTVELKNVYKPDTGKLTITKKVTKNKSDIPVPEKYYFAVKNSDGKYITDKNGTVGTTTPVYPFDVTADGSVTIDKLPIGEYTIEEKDANIANYTLKVTGLKDAIQVTKDDESKREVTNAYETPKAKEGALVIEKKAGSTGMPSETEYPIGVKFSQEGSFTVNDSIMTFTANQYKIFKLKAGEKVTIKNIPEGVIYDVNEDLTGYEGYSNPDYEFSNNTKKIVDGKQDTVTVTNYYEAPTRSFTIEKKRAEGSDGFPDTAKTFPIKVKFGKTGNFKVSVNGGAAKTLSVSSTTTYVEVAVLGENDKVTVSEIPDGTTYDVMEDITDSTKYANFEEPSYDNKTGTLNSKQIAEVKVYNTYTDQNKGKGNLQIVKTIEGPDDLDIDKAKTSIKFKITGVNTHYSKEISLSEFTASSGRYIYNLKDIDNDTYIVQETNSGIEGVKQVSVQYSVGTNGNYIEGTTTGNIIVDSDLQVVNFKNTYDKDDTSEEEASTSEESTTTSEQATTKQEAATSEQATTATEQATTTVQNVTTQSKTVTTKKTTESDEDDEEDDEDEDDGKGTLIVTIYDEKTGNVVPGAKITLTKPNGSTKKYVTDKNGQVTIKNTPVGDYTVAVTEVPQGYTVTENAEVDVEVKKNKTTKAQVKIDKDGEVSVTSKVTNSAYKTGDSVPIIPVTAAFITAVLGLVILTVKKRREM